MLNFLKAHPIKLGLIVLLLGMIVAVGGHVLLQYYDLQALITIIQNYAEVVARANPIYFIILIGVVPLFILPVSGFLVVAGVVYETRMAIAVSISGMALSNVLGYYIAAFAFRGYIKTLFKRKKIQVPEFSDSDAVRVIALFRLMPGFPLVFQNYILGFARVPFKPFFWLSIVIQMIPTVGLVVFGDSILEGKWGTAFLGISLVIVASIVAKMVLDYQKRKGERNDVVQQSVSD